MYGSVFLIFFLTAQPYSTTIVPISSGSLEDVLRQYGLLVRDPHLVGIVPEADIDDEAAGNPAGRHHIGAIEGRGVGVDGVDEFALFQVGEGAESDHLRLREGIKFRGVGVGIFIGYLVCLGVGVVAQDLRRVCVRCGV